MNAPVPTLAAPSWWPLTRKIRSVVAAYVGLELAAVAGELTTGSPGWLLLAAGALPGLGGCVAGYLTSE